MNGVGKRRPWICPGQTNQENFYPRARSDHKGVVSGMLLTCRHGPDHLLVVSVLTPGVLPILAGLFVAPKSEVGGVAIGLRPPRRIPVGGPPAWSGKTPSLEAFLGQ